MIEREALIETARDWAASQDKESKARHLVEVLTDALAKTDAPPSQAEVDAGAAAIFARDVPGRSLGSMSVTVRDNYAGDARAALEAALTVRRG